MELLNCLVNGIIDGLIYVIRNGDLDYLYFGCVNLFFVFVEGESLLMVFKDVVFLLGR